MLELEAHQAAGGEAAGEAEAGGGTVGEAGRGEAAVGRVDEAVLGEAQADAPGQRAAAAGGGEAKGVAGARLFEAARPRCVIAVRTLEGERGPGGAAPGGQQPHHLAFAARAEGEARLVGAQAESAQLEAPAGAPGRGAGLEVEGGRQAAAGAAEVGVEGAESGEAPRAGAEAELATALGQAAAEQLGGEQEVGRGVAGGELHGGARSPAARAGEPASRFLGGSRAGERLGARQVAADLGLEGAALAVELQRQRDDARVLVLGHVVGGEPRHRALGAQAPTPAPCARRLTGRRAATRAARRDVRRRDRRQGLAPGAGGIAVAGTAVAGGGVPCRGLGGLGGAEAPAGGGAPQPQLDAVEARFEGQQRVVDQGVDGEGGDGGDVEVVDHQAHRGGIEGRLPARREAREGGRHLLPGCRRAGGEDRRGGGGGGRGSCGGEAVAGRRRGSSLPLGGRGVLPRRDAQHHAARAEGDHPPARERRGLQRHRVGRPGGQCRVDRFALRAGELDAVEETRRAALPGEERTTLRGGRAGGPGLELDPLGEQGEALCPGRLAQRVAGEDGAHPPVVQPGAEGGGFGDAGPPARRTGAHHPRRAPAGALDLHLVAQGAGHQRPAEHQLAGPHHLAVAGGVGPQLRLAALDRHQLDRLGGDLLRRLDHQLQAVAAEEGGRQRRARRHRHRLAGARQDHEAVERHAVEAPATDQAAGAGGGDQAARQQPLLAAHQGAGQRLDDGHRLHRQRRCQGVAIDHRDERRPRAARAIGVDQRDVVAARRGVAAHRQPRLGELGGEHPQRREAQQRVGLQARSGLESAAEQAHRDPLGALGHLRRHHPFELDLAHHLDLQRHPQGGGGGGARGDRGRQAQGVEAGGGGGRRGDPEAAARRGTAGRHTDGDRRRLRGQAGGRAGEREDEAAAAEVAVRHGQRYRFAAGAGGQPHPGRRQTDVAPRRLDVHLHLGDQVEHRLAQANPVAAGRRAGRGLDGEADGRRCIAGGREGQRVRVDPQSGRRFGAEGEPATRLAARHLQAERCAPFAGDQPQRGWHDPHGHRRCRRRRCLRGRCLRRDLEGHREAEPGAGVGERDRVAARRGAGAGGEGERRAAAGRPRRDGDGDRRRGHHRLAGEGRRQGGLEVQRAPGEVLHRDRQRRAGGAGREAQRRRRDGHGRRRHPQCDGGEADGEVARSDLQWVAARRGRRRGG